MRPVLRYLLLLAPGKGGAPGPYPPPAGYRWGYVTEDTVTVTEDGAAVVKLEKAA